LISREDLVRAIDNSTPYPIEMSYDVMYYMAGKLMEMCLIEKNESHELWQPEPEPEPGPEPVEIPPGAPNPNG
jgi:hypothetical protein